MRGARGWDVVFFCSGAAALVYQVVWMRLLVRLLGSDASGAACVLSVTMLGLGVGARAAAPAFARIARPRVAYALICAFTALWAAASPLLIEALDPVKGLGMRWTLAALVLLPPTLAMGATFPLMGRLRLTGENDGRGVAAFYGANTLGAAAGALVAPFAFMPLLGLAGALMAGAVLDLVAAVGALLVPGVEVAGPVTGRDSQRPRRASSASSTSTGGARGTIYAATALLGATGLALEVLWTRLLVSVTGASVYAFALMLTVFLAGIGLGGRQGTKLVDGAHGRRVLATCALAIPAATLVGALALRHQLGEPDLFASLTNRLPTGASTLRLWLSHALFAGLALFGPAVGLGLALPAAAAALFGADARGGRERELGRLYAWNTAGAAAGSLATALVLLPAVGPRASFFLALAPAWLAGLLLLRSLTPRIAVTAVVVAALAGVWVGRPAQEHARTIVAHDVGRLSTAAVERDGEGTTSLRVDGKVVASTAPVDQRLQRLLGHIPGLLHGEVRRALVIGLGTGMTAGALLDLPTLEELDVIELSAAVARVSAHFAPWNGDLGRDPRATVRLADGRHALAISEERWDLITADPIHPWTRGSSDLYSLEHFTEIAEHLTPGGVASQWLPLYQLSTEDVRTVVATWCAVFPHASAWLTAYDLALVGSLAPLPAANDPAAWVLPERVSRHLAEVGVGSPAALVALRVADEADLLAFAAGMAPMTANRPRLEFSAPKSYLAGYSLEALRWAARPDFVPQLPPFAREEGTRARAALEAFLAELPAGVERAAARYGERLLGRDPDRE